ncbi:MAG: Appr-1-p processing protein [Planctomycetota bacterium]|nr:MAG: Appr-1-p processing protein [Planctomycetota bacterium]
MVHLTRGNILEADAEALVNTVNCAGVMGKGIALQFKQAFPANYEAYRLACNAGQVRPGRMFVFETGLLQNPRFIINFPTKRHWRGQARMEDIEAGLQALTEEVRRRSIRSIAVPPLGCGFGGLRWDDVRPRIEGAFHNLLDVQVLLFEPAGAPEPAERPVRTEQPKLTRARALYLLLMEQYAALGYERTQLEIQKLAYFLQEAGEPLRLRFTAAHYGPYADNLNKVLETLEGHYTRGYEGARNPETAIELLPGAVEEARTFLAGDHDAQERLGRIGRLIEGFETPYGMELLASIHWLAIHANPPAHSEDEALRQLQSWSQRKRHLFRPEHVHRAWERLAEQGWLNGMTATCH